MTKDILEMILNEEFNDMVKNLDSGEDSEKIDLINNHGDLLAPVNVDSDKIVSLFDEYEDIDAEYIDKGYAFEAIGSSIKKVKCSLKKALLIENEMIENNSNKFAGMLAYNRGANFAVNISHPYVKFLISKSLFKVPKGTEFWIFEYCKGHKFDDKTIERSFEANSLMLSFLDKSIKTNVEYKSRVINQNTDFEQITSLAFMNAEVRVEKRLDINTIVIPLQIFSKGFFIPYFGWAVINNTPSGVNLFGNKTGNLGRLRGHSNVCTGELNNTTLQGWYTLSKVNTTSMYFDYCLHPEFKEYNLGAMLAGQKFLFS